MKKLNSLLTIFLLSCIFASCNSDSKPTKQNFLFILVDDLGWADVQCNNPKSFYETPNINKLAEAGVRFSNGYASCPVCSPTRASLMTGKYPTVHGITDWIPGADPKNRKLLGTEDLHELPLQEVTIAEVLRENGYKTGFFGKWHLGDEGFYPENQGFEINIGGHHRGSPPGGYYSPYKNPKMEDGPEGEYLTDRLTNETIHFIEENKNQPFFAYLSFYTVHTPIQAAKKHIEKFKAKAEKLPELKMPLAPEHEGMNKARQDRPDYASMVYAMDENVGRLIDKLKELGLDKNTTVIFTSDNGGLSTLYADRKGNPTSNLPLRAGKGWCYEGGIRVPLIIKSPVKNFKPGISETPAISNDMFATILDIAGINNDTKTNGVSLLPEITGQKIDRQNLFWHYPHYHGSSWTPGSAVRSGNWKLVRFYEYEKTELYNLKTDPGEQNNLAESHPKKLKELNQLLDNWLKETNAKLPKKNLGYKE